MDPACSCPRILRTPLPIRTPVDTVCKDTFPHAPPSPESVCFLVAASVPFLSDDQLVLFLVAFKDVDLFEFLLNFSREADIPFFVQFLLGSLHKIIVKFFDVLLLIQLLLKSH